MPSSLYTPLIIAANSNPEITIPQSLNTNAYIIICLGTVETLKHLHATFILHGNLVQTSEKRLTMILVKKIPKVQSP